MTATPTALPMHLVSSQPLSPSLLKDTPTKEPNNSSTVVLIGAGSGETTSPPPKVVGTPPHGLNLGPSLSIMPVFDPPPSGSNQIGSMSMKDVVDSITKKNYMMVDDTITTTNATGGTVQSLVETDTKPRTTATVSVARPPRMPKRSPSQHQNDHSFVGGSLLKPLLALTSQQKEAVDNITSSSLTITPASSSSSASLIMNLNHHHGDSLADSESSHKNYAKRRRRDTDSSTKSDKSDISLISIESSNSVTITTSSTSASSSVAKKALAASKANKLLVNDEIMAVGNNPTMTKAGRNAKGRIFFVVL
jgi:hypothetical protein